MGELPWTPNLENWWGDRKGGAFTEYLLHFSHFRVNENNNNG